jgi:MFS family permease
MQRWKRTFAAVWLANTITAVGMMAFLPFFPSHLEHLGLTDRDAIATWAGVLYGAAPLTAALAGPLWGVIGDRVGRRVMVLRSMIAITLFVGAMAFARTPWELLALRIAQGMFSGFVAPSMTLVSVLAPAHAQSRTSGWLNSSMVIGAVLGPAVGELLRAAFGVEQVYWTVSLLSAVSALLGSCSPTKTARSAATRGRRCDGRRSCATASATSASCAATRRLRATVVLLFWLQFGLGATNPLLELHVRDLTTHLDFLHPSTSALFFTMAAANLLCMPFWARYGDRRGPYAALLRCSVACGGALLLQALAQSYELLLLGRIAFGAAMAGSAALAFGVAAAESSTERRGGAMGLVFSARAFAIAIASMCGGFVSAWTGVRGLFLISAVVLFAAVAWLRRAREPALRPRRRRGSCN